MGNDILENKISLIKIFGKMYQSEWDGIQETLEELKALRRDVEDTNCYLDSFEYLLRGRTVQNIQEVRPHKNKKVVNEGSQNLPQLASRFSPETRKRLREPTVSPVPPAAKNPGYVI